MKKLIPVAVAAALAGVNSAQAVHVNPDGHGQVLLYPYYTVEGGQDTYINLVNTTNEYKAVKVRFIESMNSREVLDFNLYLSPYDHWSAVVFADGDGASVKTADTSCTVPGSLSAKKEGETGATVPFRNFTFSRDTIDIDGNGVAENTVARTKEGYVEIIEMGRVDVDNGIPLPDDLPEDTLGELLQFAIKHVNGVPGGCAILSAAWSSNDLWGGNPGLAMLNPTGGLYGYGVLIDVAEGTDATYDAIAMDSFFNTSFHTDPGSTDPGLDDGVTQYFVFDAANPSTVTSGSAASGLDAVSAVLMVSAIDNDYVLEPTIQAGTDWVLTMPTKRDYVNTGADFTASNSATNPWVYAPFTRPWTGSDTASSGDLTKVPAPACEAIGITFFDREERSQTPDELDFSPRPPGSEPFALCAEANVLTFNDSNVLEASARTGSSFSVPFDNGWANLNFTNSVFSSLPTVWIPGFGDATPGVARELEAGVNTFSGLPVVGFAVQKYVNGDVGGVLSNYAGSVTHKGERSIVSSGPI
jgi:hypothetical protein